MTWWQHLLKVLLLTTAIVVGGLLFIIAVCAMPNNYSDEKPKPPSTDHIDKGELLSKGEKRPETQPQ